MKMFMVDLETLGINPGCVILSIGAVRFDSGKPGDWFYSRIDLKSALAAGFRVEADTLMWWFRQGETALEHGSTDGAEDVVQALHRFRGYLGQDRFELWGNGPSFDNEIVRVAMRRCGIVAWDRRADRCYRTLCLTGGAGVPKDYDAVFPLIDPPVFWRSSGGRHHALRDAACQAAHAERIFQRIGIPL